MNAHVSSLIRINKYLAQWGNVSRRQADDLIKKGKVFLNGSKITNIGTLINPDKDYIRIQNKLILKSQIKSHYILLNKPENVLTATQDPKNRLTVMNLIKKPKQRIFPVGRLDWASEGLLILTNDGELAQKILHPKYKVTKTYMVKIQGNPSESQLKKLSNGVHTRFGKMKARYVKRVSPFKQKNPWIKILISEGKNRQIRYMFESLGYQIHKLRRVAIGRLKMSKLKKGHYIIVKKSDIEKVFLKPKELSH